MAKHWTQEEISYLEMYWGTHSIESIAEYLNRPFGAIRSKARRLGLGGATMTTSRITSYQLSVITGVDRKTVKRWMNKGLPFKKQKLTKMYNYFIEPQDFWKWAKEHKHIDFRKIERGLLIPEPDWLYEKIRDQYDNTLRRHRTFWSTMDDVRLRDMLAKGYTYARIGKELERTEKAIGRRIKFLYEKSHKGA